MRTRKLNLALSLLLAVFLIQAPAAFAKKGGGGNSGGGGGGQGQTKIDFEVTIGNPSTSKVFAKREVAAGVAQLPAVGSSTLNDELAGQIVSVFIGDSLTTGTANSKGKVSTPFAAKLTSNGRYMQVTIEDLDLETLMGLNPTDGTYATVVQIVITTTYVDADTLLPVTVILSDEMVTFNYTVSSGKVKGRNY